MKTTKNLIKILISMAIAWTLVIGTNLNAQDETLIDKIDVPLTKPGAAVKLHVKLMNNDLSIVGYNGKITIVEIVKAPMMKKIVSKSSRSRSRSRSRKSTGDKNKAKGMFRISKPGIALSIQEENNIIQVKNNYYTDTENTLVRIKTPFNTSVKVSLMTGGSIQIDGVNGEHVVKHHNGAIRMKDISGSVIANSMNGDVSVAFDKINQSKPMAFSTFNGDVDITIPAKSKFDFKLKSHHGEIFSDFKLQMDPNQKKTRKKVESKGGKFKVNFDNTIYASLNGGGEEIFCKTWQGDIYIRKKK